MSPYFQVLMETCPVCGTKARVSHQWVLNKYGIRYDYTIYHHKEGMHYVNADKKINGYLKKGDIERKLVEMLASPQFKQGLFRLGDVKKALLPDFPDVAYGTVKVNLMKIAHAGLLEVRTKGRDVYWENMMSKDRLSYIVKSLKIALCDARNEFLFYDHRYAYKIRNDHAWPLYYLPFRVVSDVEITMQKLKMTATTPRELLTIIPIENDPLRKKVLLKMTKPILPGEEEEVRIKYILPEPAQVFTYTSATTTKHLKFIMSSNVDITIAPSLTSGSRSEITDLTGVVRRNASMKDGYRMELDIPDVQPFASIRIEWKRADALSDGLDDRINTKRRYEHK